MASSSFPLSKAYFVALFCEAILHGFFTALAAGAIYLLLRKRAQEKKRGEKNTSPNTLMLFLTVLMYSLSTVHIALSCRQNLIAFFDQHAADGGLSILNDQGNPIVFIQIAVEVINCLLGDSIVAWRAWVLWGRNYRIIIPAMVCILGGLVSGIGMVHAFAVSPPGEEVYNNDITNWFLSFGALTCISNVYCVIVIGYKAWATFHFLRKHSRGVIHGGTYHGALLVIIESGVLYSVVLIVTVILFATDNNGVYVLADILGHLTGIYPTVIIVLVSMKMSFYDDMTHAEKTMTTFQAQWGSGQSTTMQLRRRTGGAESEESDSTFVLESLPHQTARDVRGFELNGPSKAKSVDIV
ncbi:hypothetical protein GSI_05443 [Ganoderma sinense ZZ0214-1]|uniref:Uncharacterized protein n=1 Tax=Ganoderma sinense ZZ0214-1 TaxID=1077348 RepID=A0A2G8SF44_9APHY|nr:hypothetical protein GSI_05443 [Ganoderma sinense ZZ0214-1]